MIATLGSLVVLAIPLVWGVRKYVRDLVQDGASRLVKAGLTTTLLVTWALAASAMTWGLPDSRGWAPDELMPFSVIDGLTAGFSDGWHSVPPYPPLHFYLLAIVLLPFQITAHLGLTDLSSEQTYFAMFLLQRSVSGVLAVATIYLVYLCGRQLHDSRAAGIGSALLVASMPPFIYYASLANVDVPYTFWLTFSLLHYIQFVRTHQRRRPVRLCPDGDAGDLYQGSGVWFLRPPGRPYPLAALAPCDSRSRTRAVERSPPPGRLRRSGSGLRTGTQPRIQLRRLCCACGDHSGIRTLRATIRSHVQRPRAHGP